MKKKSFEEARNRINRLSESLFGQASETDYSEAEELVRVAGLEPDDLKASLYRRLYMQAQQYWMAQKPLPTLLKKALDDLRPLTAPARNEKELGLQAKARIQRLLEQAKLLRLLVPTTTVPEFATNYRKKGAVSPKDRMVLDAITDELAGRFNLPRERDKE